MFGKHIECNFVPGTKVTKASLGNGGTSYLVQKHFLQWMLRNEIISGPILDMGLGRGEIGLALRNAGFEGQITGLDICEDYIKGSVNVYSDIYICNIVELLKDLPIEELDKFGTIIWLDVLEHLDAEDGLMVLEKMFQSKAKIVIGTPNYEYRQRGTETNPFEEHKSHWDCRLLTQFNPDLALFDNIGAATYLWDQSDKTGNIPLLKYEQSKVQKREVPKLLEDTGFGEGIWDVSAKVKIADLSELK